MESIVAKTDKTPEKDKDEFAKLMLGTAVAWGAVKLVSKAYDVYVVGRRSTDPTETEK